MSIFVADGVNEGSVCNVVCMIETQNVSDEDMEDEEAFFLVRIRSCQR